MFRLGMAKAHPVWLLVSLEPSVYINRWFECSQIFSLAAIDSRGIFSSFFFEFGVQTYIKCGLTPIPIRDYLFGV